MHLVGGITGAAASLVVDVTTGLPSVPFTLLLDLGLGVEEVVTVTAVGGATLTVTRGVGGTSAQAHTNGAEVRHAYYGQDFQDSRDHEASTTAHAATGAVVGTTNVQTLTGKTMSGASNTFSAIPTTALASGPLSGTNFHNAVSAESTTNSVGIATRTILLSAPSITGDGVAKFKITVNFAAITSVGANDVFSLTIEDSTTSAVLTSRTVWMPATAGSATGACITTVDVPAAGAHVYRLYGDHVAGSGAGTIAATTTAPLEIIVEQIA